MIKRKLSEADWFLIAANLLPVYGVWFLHWDPRELFLVYCLESIIIGLFTLVKLGVATVVRKFDWWENNGSRTLMHGSFFMFFFLLHYGFFVALQTSIFLSTLSIHGSHASNILQVISNLPLYLGRGAWVSLLLFVFVYGYENLAPFIQNYEYRRKSFARIMFEPYLRIFVQQFTVILGSLALTLGAGKLFMLIFAAAKIFFTVFIRYDALFRHSLLQKEKAS